MALTYRSPLEDIVAAFEPTVQSTIASTAALCYKELEQENFRQFNFAMNAKAKEKLSSAGIYLSPYSAVPHSHPVCKTLENYILYKVLPSYLDSSFFFVGIKEFKLELLKRREKGLDLISCINRFVTSADKLRYGSEFVKICSKPSPEFTCKEHFTCEPTLKDLVPMTMSRAAKKLFLHDELHYWKKNTLLNFLEVLDPDIIIGTVVFPPELLIGAKSSLNRWCYEYELVGKKLHYYPDGVRGEGYEQPIEGGYLLKTNKLRTMNGVIYCVDVLCSKFSHHLIAITKGDAITQSRRSFGNFEATSMRGLKHLAAHNLKFLPISFETVSKIYRYLRTLKKPDTQSAMAKLSQLLPNPTGFEIKFITEFSELVIKTKGVRSMLCPSSFMNWLSSLGQILPDCIKHRMSSVVEISLDEFVTWFEPLCFSVDLKLVEHSTFDEMLFRFKDADVEKEIELPGLLEGFENGRGRNLERLRQPYEGSAPLHGRLVWRLEITRNKLVWNLSKLIIGSFCNVTGDLSINDDELVQHIFFFLKRSAIVPAGDYKESGKNFSKLLSEVRARIAALCVRKKSRVIFSHSSQFEWFTGFYRYNTWSLCDKSEGKGASKHFQNMWSTIVGDVVKKGNVRHKLKPIEKIVEVKRLQREQEDDAQDFADCEKINFSSQWDPVIEGREVGKEKPCAVGEIFNIHQKSALLEIAQVMHNGVGGESTIFCSSRLKEALANEKIVLRTIPHNFPLVLENSELELDYNCVFLSSIAELGVEDAHFEFFLKMQKLADEVIFTGERLNCFTQMSNSIGLHNIALEGAEGLKIRKNEINAKVTSITCHGKIVVALARVGEECIPRRVLREHIEQKVQEEEHEQDSIRLSEELDGGMKAEFFLNKVKVTCESTGLDKKFEETDVPGDGNCFWHCLALGIDCNWEEAKRLCVVKLKVLNQNITGTMERQIAENGYAEDEIIGVAAIVFGLIIEIYNEDYSLRNTFDPTSWYQESEGDVGKRGRIHLINCGLHFKLLRPLNNCLAEAVSQALRRSIWDILRVMEVNLDDETNDKIWAGEGVNEAELDLVFTTFGIRAIVEKDGNCIEFNHSGRVSCFFEIGEEHISFVKKARKQDFKLLKVHASSKCVNLDSVAQLALAGTALEYDVNSGRANALANSLFETSTGVLSSNLFNGRKHLTEGVAPVDGPRKVVAILGTFGAGKSTLFIEFMKKNLGKAVDYVSPRKVLAQDFKVKVGIESTDKNARRNKGRAGSERWKVSTFETFLMRAESLIEGQALIIDEIQLYPPGYLDLVCTLVNEKVHIFVVGDPCQSEYDNESDRYIFCDSKSDVEKLLTNMEYTYNISSLRFSNANFKGRIPCELKMTEQKEINEPYVIFEGVDSLCSVPDDFKELFLVSSFIERKIVQCYVSQDARVLTFGESTGITVQKCTILLTKAAEHSSEKRWLTALSRARLNICFVNVSGLSLESLATVYSKRAFGKFLTGRAKLDDLREHLPGEPKFREGFYQQLGKNEGVMEEKLQGDPWLKCMVDLLQEEDSEEIEENLEIMQEEWFKTHLPQCELESVRARWVHKILSKESREVRMGGIVSEQFTDEHSKQPGQQLTNACERFETIYPRHKASDTVTFIMAVKKRLRFSTPAKEKAKLFEACNFGAGLLKIFLDKIPLRGAHNPDMMARAKREFELKKTSKSAAVIENHSGRSCRDWLADIGLVFSKSQICTKFDNRFRDAKAAQTIVCFQHAVLCRFAPYMRYIEMKLQEVLPRKYYVHSGKKLEELDEWVKEGQFSGFCTESDYEAFDASQDQYIVAFELAIMRHLGLPRDLIEDYVYIKTHLGSKLGNFAIMRFSGEASTFLFNTMANMLFTFMRYSIKGDEYICFAGDDMCSSKRLVIKNEHEDFLRKLKLKAKVQHTIKPTFCGWNLSPDGIYKKPQLVLERMCIAKELNNLKNCIDNYAIEVAFAYKLGEKAVMRMDEEELEAFYNCVRIIIKNKHLLKSDVIDVYQKGLEA